MTKQFAQLTSKTQHLGAREGPRTFRHQLRSTAVVLCLALVATIVLLAPSSEAQELGVPLAPVLEVDDGVLRWTQPDNGVEVGGHNIHTGAGDYVATVNGPDSWDAGGRLGEYFVTAFDRTPAAAQISERSNTVTVGDPEVVPPEVLPPETFPRQPIPPLQPGDENRRQRAVDQIVEAFESYGAANGTYVIEGAGRPGFGNGWVFHQTPESRYPTPYPTSIASVLIAEGHLSGPIHDELWASERYTYGDVRAYQCEDRVAVFTVHGDGEPSDWDRNWWADNDCDQHRPDFSPRYFKLSRSLDDDAIPVTEEDLRQGAVGEFLNALEAYNEDNGTYRVEDSGFRGRGSGWAFYQDEEPGGDYPVSIANALIEGGYLEGVYTQRDPLWENAQSIVGDFMVYRCKDRTAVFAIDGVGEPSKADRDWWADYNNDCFRYPIDRFDATYYALSPDPEIPRKAAMVEMLRALEIYGAANGTYRVEGGGFQGRGSGWGFAVDEEPGGNYPVSIATVLIDGLYLSADVAHDPRWESPLSVVGDVMVYQCGDRVAVFSRESDSRPTKFDRDWWEDNDCNRYPIDRMNANYFILSGPLLEYRIAWPPLPVDEPGPNVDDYLGLAIAEAIALADAQGQVWRIVREDDILFPVTQSVIPTRLNFATDGGFVTMVSLG